ncbi:MAG TPA: alpha-L-fucosidase [Rugosimonospora sp.]|nr:alpha-L-fucosidase [Rugosimonospora sp.]
MAEPMPRFGLFVHWGLYALAARNEWLRHRERMSNVDYQRYFDHFYPDRYDPRAWAAAAEAAGARYLVVTTKHHDGFCLWDSALTEYKATRTPWGRDLIAPLVGALRERDLGVGFYHSLIDWHHPQFPIDGLHPERDNAVLRAQPRDIAAYRGYLHGQVRELLTGYGRIDELWLDFSYRDHVHEGVPVWGGKGAADWGGEALLAMVRELQPGILVNDRLDVPGDFVTPEQYQPSAPPTRDGRPVRWEACQTLNGSWGYDRDNQDYKSPGLLLRMLVDTVAKDGSLLLNVGPTGRGEFDPRAVEILGEIGRWLHPHGRAIHGAGASGYAPPPDCRYTQRGDRLYLHLFAWPFERVHLPGLAGRVAYAQLLHDASEVRIGRPDPDEEGYTTRPGAQPPDTLTLELPVRRPEVAIPVIELFLKPPGGA